MAEAQRKLVPPNPNIANVLRRPGLFDTKKSVRNQRVSEGLSVGRTVKACSTSGQNELLLGVCVGRNVREIADHDFLFRRDGSSKADRVLISI